MNVLFSALKRISRSPHPLGHPTINLDLAQLTPVSSTLKHILVGTTGYLIHSHPVVYSSNDMSDSDDTTPKKTGENLKQKDEEEKSWSGSMHRSYKTDESSKKKGSTEESGSSTPSEYATRGGLKKSVNDNKENKNKIVSEINESFNSKISLFCGDITALEIDAIANAANESLMGGGGVDGAIHSASGRGLVSECEILHGCETGKAKITGGYNLPAKYVIHTVGPRRENSKLLESCYKETLDRLKENELKSVAFPCISTGIFGYPNENAAVVALKTVRDWLEHEDYAKNVRNLRTRGGT